MSEYGSDDSSELVSHQMAHPSLCRTRFPSWAPIKSLAVLSLRVPLQLKGCTGTPTLSSTTTPSGASVLQVHFALWHSTSASGPNRRVPPPRGLLPRCPSGAFPSSSVSSSPLSLYEAFPHSEVRRLWALLWSGPLSLLSWVRGLSCCPLCATGISSGADGRVSRLRSTSPSAIVFSIPSLLCSCGRSDVFPDRVRVRGQSLFVLLSFHCSRVCGSHATPLCFPFFKFQVAWSGVRLVSSD